MDSIVDGLTSNNGWVIALLIVALVLICIKGARHGLFTFKSDKIQIGKNNRELELTIVRQQFEYAKNTIDGLEKDIPKFEEYNQLRAKIILEKILDEIFKWCVFNHIDRTKSYIGTKTKMIKNIIKKNSENTSYMTDEFNKFVEKEVKDMILELINIREEYNKISKED